MNKTWIISDTHFYHNNIIKYCGRPHNHNELMWEGLRTVGSKDTLIHGGDVCFFTSKTKSQARKVFDMLPGKEKVLIIGNHDRSDVKKLEWDEVVKEKQFIYHGLAIHIQHFSFKKADNIGPGVRRFARFFLSDWCNVNLTLPKADICIHGHIHNLGRRYLWVEQTKQLVVNMCVEHWDYKPIDLDIIIQEYRAYQK